VEAKAVEAQPWFGREPALVISTIASVAGLLIALGATHLSWMHWLNAAFVAALVVFLNAVAGVLVAVRTRPWGPAIFSTVIVAAVGLLAAVGFQVTPDVLASVQLVAAAAVTMWTRTQVTPEHDPAPLPGGVLVELPSR
jgi:hypothetical protein